MGKTHQVLVLLVVLGLGCAIGWVAGRKYPVERWEGGSRLEKSSGVSDVVVNRSQRRGSDGPVGSSARAPGFGFRSGEAREWLFRQVRDLKESDVGSMFRFVERASRLSDEQARELLVESIDLLRAFRRGDPEVLSVIHDGDLLQFALLNSAYLCSRSDPSGTMDLLVGADVEIDQDVYGLVVSDLVGVDPVSAESALLKLEGEALEGGLAGFVTAIGKMDPDRAIDVVKRYPGVDVSSASKDLVKDLMAKNPEEGMRAAIELYEERDAFDLIEGAVEYWRFLDRAAAEEWVFGYNGEHKDAVRETMERLNDQER
jgi:hypothetical protein